MARPCCCISPRPIQSSAAPPAITIDRQQRSVWLAGEHVALGGRAFDLLAALTVRPGDVHSVEALHLAVWPGMPVEPNNVRVQVLALRQRLGAACTVNVPRHGYRWAGPVHEAGAAPGPVLVGRDDELQVLRTLAARHRLVNVVGAGGIGKTSLVRAWQQGLPALARGPAIITVELAPLAAGDAVLPAVGQALAPLLPPPALVAGSAADATAGAATDTTTDTTTGAAALAAQLAALPTLPHVVLDNAEHLVDTVGPLVQTLLDAVPALHVVVTSQVPLRLPGEQLLRLSPLELPERDVTLAQARAVGALVLFADRVRALDPGFALTAANLATVADICCRLDGLPLALELAAARVPSLGLPTLQRALNERLALLTGGPGHAPARQRTLRATLDWSHGLLDLATQQVFCRLGTFSGPFTLAQAQRALAPSQAEFPDWSVVDAVGRLVDASLVCHDGGEPPRYRLLELPRAFALERLGLPQPKPVPDGGSPASALLQRLVQRVGSDSGGDGGGGVALDGQAVLALARQLQPDDLRQFDTALQELQRAVALAGGVLAHQDTGADSDGRPDAGDGTEQVLAAVAEQTRLGQLDRGADELDAAVAELQRRDERRRTALRRSWRSLLQASERQHLLRRDAPAVARAVEALAAFDHPLRPSWAASYIEQETRYLDDGLRPGHLLQLQVGVQLARRRLDTAANPAERLALRRVLVRALVEQGRRESTHATLLDGVQLCRQALADVDRASAPLDWAALQHDLGSLLNQLSYRTGDGALMEEAEACSRRALQERSAEHTPLDWADSQRQLAVTLRNLGQREADNRRLLEAVAACRAGLTACLDPAVQPGPPSPTTQPAQPAMTRTAQMSQTAPQLHAHIQDALATTLIQLGRGTSSAALLREAVAASRSALAGVSRQQAPQLWGDYSSHLGIALGMLGEAELEPDAGRALQALNDAVLAFGDALSVVSPDGDAVTYAMQLHNLASVLRKLGKREPGTQRLEQSASHSRQALAYFPRDRFPMYWAAAQHDLSSTLQALAKRLAQDRCNDQALAMLEQAAQAAGQALEERTRERSPLDWAHTLGHLATIWLDIGRCGNDPARAHAALAAWEETLPVLAGDGGAAPRADALAGMAQARAWLAAG